MPIHSQFRIQVSSLLQRIEKPRGLGAFVRLGDRKAEGRILQGSLDGASQATFLYIQRMPRASHSTIPLLRMQQCLFPRVRTAVMRGAEDARLIVTAR